jgi:hypothetical protein
MINSNNPVDNVMAINILSASMLALDEMSERPAFKSKRKVPMGLVTCCSIVEAKRVCEYMEAKGATAEVICSDDEKAAARLRALSNGSAKNPPQWLVTVGMVSEGVDIPAIKIIAYLNQITTPLFLIQLFGRALRRIPVGSGYLDSSLTETTAKVFAPAHPRIVKIGTELEDIGNQAIKESIKKDGGNEPSEPRKEKRYSTESDGANIFFRGVEIKDPDLVRMLNAIQIDADAMESLTPIWLDMVCAWIKNGKEDKAIEEVEARLNEYGISLDVFANSYSEGLDYDTEKNLEKKEAQRNTQMLRFSHPDYVLLSDGEAFSQVRRDVCKRAFGSFKEVKKMTLEELRAYNKTAQEIYYDARN